MRMLAPFIASMLSLIASASYAADNEADNEYPVAIQDKAFNPPVIEIPADTKVKLIVTNERAVPAEFESNDFKREKVISPKAKATIPVGPLKAGSYIFFDEFNPPVEGKLVVK